MRLELNGKWNMVRQRDGKVFSADIPGTDFGALIKCGEIRNPLISGDENEALVTASDNYAFSRSFTVNEAMLNKKFALLKCSRVDTLCEVYINGKKVLSLNNAYVPLDDDIKGFLQVKEKYPECVTIFLMPPSMDELKRRLKKRGTESDEVISQRLKQAEFELPYQKYFDYCVLNDDSDRAAEEILSIISNKK